MSTVLVLLHLFPGLRIFVAKSRDLTLDVARVIIFFRLPLLSLGLN